MTDDLLLRRKWTLRAHGQRVVFVKHAQERAAHVLMKAFIWALYLPDYPDLAVEIRIADHFKPDVVSLDGQGVPRFWGEAGRVGVKKINYLARRYRDTHVAIAKWDTRLDPLVGLVEAAVEGRQRTAPFDLINFAPDSAARFIDARGQVTLTHADLTWVRIGGGEAPGKTRPDPVL